MRNLRFCAAAVILLAVMIVCGYSLLRSGDATAKMIEIKASAAQNATKQQDSTLEPYVKDPVTTPTEPCELTEDIISKVTIDGIEIQLPIKLCDLPDDFDYTLSSYFDNKTNDKSEKYNGIIILHYKNQHIGSAIVSNNKPEINDDTVVTRMIFMNETNKYIPQITVAGFDVFDTDIHEFNKIYGIASDEYGYNMFEVKGKDNRYYLSVSTDNKTILDINCFDYNDEAVAYKPSLWIYEPDNISLPENYTPENDKANNAMEYVTIPEKNEELKEFVTNIQSKISLPCTLNYFIYTKGVDAYFKGVAITDWYEEHGKFKASVRFNGEYIDILITPGKPLGEAQVIKFCDYSPSDASELIEQIKADNPYGFKYIEKFDIYYLTDYEENNVKIDDDYITYSYWPENLTKQYE